MFGKPSDVEGECNAHLYLGDDYGDNTCTIRCHLPQGHDAPHKEVCRDGDVTITWSEDEREVCEVCGGRISGNPVFCEKCWSATLCSGECLSAHDPLCKGEAQDVVE